MPTVQAMATVIWAQVESEMGPVGEKESER